MGKSNRLRIIIAERRIHQKELAKQVGIRESTLSEIVNEKREPTLTTAMKIARALGMEVGQIWELEEDK